MLRVNEINRSDPLNLLVNTSVGMWKIEDYLL